MASLLFCVADDALYHLVNFLFAPCNFIGQHPHPYGVSQAHLVRVQRLRQPLGAGFVLIAVLAEPPQLGAVAHMLPPPSLHLRPQRLDGGVHVCGQIVVAVVSTDTVGYVFASADIHGVWLVPCKRLDGRHRFFTHGWSPWLRSSRPLRQASRAGRRWRFAPWLAPRVSRCHRGCRRAIPTVRCTSRRTPTPPAPASAVPRRARSSQQRTCNA